MTIKEIEDKKKDMLFRDNIWSSNALSHFTLYRNSVELDILKKFKLDSSDLVLDLGAGIGRITNEFAKSGAEIVAVDYSKNSLKVNRMSSGAHVIVADICFLPFRPSVFDKAIAISVFQYIPTPKSRFEALNEVKRAIKHNSKFLLETYNYRSLYDGLIRHRKDGWHRSVPIHYYRFSYKELIDLLSIYFNVHKIQGILILPLLIYGFIGNMKSLVKLAVFLEKIVAKINLQFFFAEHIIVTCQKL